MPKMELVPNPEVQSREKFSTKNEIESRAQLTMNNLGFKIEDLRGKKILDLGAGKAELAQWVKNQGINIVSLDSGVGYSREEIPKNIDYVWANAEELPFPDESMDLVLANGFFSGISFGRDNAVRILKEVERVLRPEGEFRIGPGYIDPNIFNPEGSLFSEEEEKNFSEEDRMRRIREKSLEFFRSVYPNVEEIPIEGKENKIDGFFYLFKK